MAKVECIFFRYKNNCNIAFIFKKLSNGRYQINRKWKIYGSYIPYNSWNIAASQLESFINTYVNS